jgi:hypothetical protein
VREIESRHVDKRLAVLDRELQSADGPRQLQLLDEMRQLRRANQGPGLARKGDRTPAIDRGEGRP